MSPVEQSWLAQFGIAGAMLFIIAAIAKMWIASNERIAMERTKVEDKKADAMAGALTSLSGKIDAHHTADIQSHSRLGEGIAEIRGQLSEAISWQERTPVEQPVPRGPTTYGIRPKTHER